MKQNDKSKPERRQFLKGAAVAGAVVGSGALSATASADAPTDKAQPVLKKGYQETDHVREYYRLARF